MTNTPNIIKESNHYITRNIAASLGLSIYVIIDTLFISIAAGPLGLTVLNLALPLFSAFNATGLLLGVGGAAYYSLNKLTHPERVEHLFSQLIIFVAGLGILVTILINLFATPLLHLLGANAATLPMGLTYVRIISLAAPFYMANYIVVNFVRNDGNPNDDRNFNRNHRGDPRRLVVHLWPRSAYGRGGPRRPLFTGLQPDGTVFSPPFQGPPAPLVLDLAAPEKRRHRRPAWGCRGL